MDNNAPDIVPSGDVLRSSSSGIWRTVSTSMQILVVDRGARRRVCVQQLACPGELQSRQMPFVPAASPEVDPAITDDGQLLATDSVSRESSSQRA
mmetsp:Transcript_115131/g.211764  ORF Transcript_115131/g.211764 Transcript_115131/m.211764 type:complete len:95 (-) Transcript_115131:37-321(-)